MMEDDIDDQIEEEIARDEQAELDMYQQQQMKPGAPQQEDDSTSSFKRRFLGGI